MTTHTAIADWIAANEHIAAPVVAFLVAYVLYGVLGKRFLGADDDFWPWIRKRAIPLLDRVAGSTPGLHVRGENFEREYAGYYKQSLTSPRLRNDPIDVFERHLESMGYSRNPLAALKTDPHGNLSDGSWARRYGGIRWTGEQIDAAATAIRSLSPVMAPVSWLVRWSARFVLSVGDVFATKQVHVTIYGERVEFEDAGDVALIHVYAHDEFNSLNPLTAALHYGADRGFSPERGIRKFRADAADAGVSIEDPP